MNKKQKITYSQLDAINTRLLASTHTDHLAIQGIADGVGLGVLQADVAQDHVIHSGVGDLLLGGHHVLHVFAGRNDIVVTLGQNASVQFTVFHLGHLEVGLALKNDEVAVLLLLQDFKGFGLVASGNDTVGDAGGDELGGSDIDDIGDSSEITEGGHGVSVTGTEVGQGGAADVGVGDFVGLHFDLGERNGDGGTGGGDMLEGGSGDDAEGFADFLDQHPAVQSITEIDVAGVAVDDFEGHLAV